MACDDALDSSQQQGPYLASMPTLIKFKCGHAFVGVSSSTLALQLVCPRRSSPQRGAALRYPKGGGH